MQVMNATFMPVVVSVRDPAYDDRYVFDVLLDDLVVGYSLGYPYGDRLTLGGCGCHAASCVIAPPVNSTRRSARWRSMDNHRR